MYIEAVRKGGGCDPNGGPTPTTTSSNTTTGPVRPLEVKTDLSFAQISSPATVSVSLSLSLSLSGLKLKMERLSKEI